VSAEAVGWVLRYSPLSGAPLLVHVAIADAMGPVLAAIPQAWLAKVARTTRGTVNKTVAALVEDGLLVVRAGKPGEACSYRVVMKPGLPERVPPLDEGGVRAENTGGVRARNTGVRAENTPPLPLSTRAPAHGSLLKPIGTPTPSGVGGSARRTPTRKEQPPVDMDPLTAEAHKLAQDEWKRRTEKPVCGFPALRSRIRDALEAGHTAEAVAKALPTMPVFSRDAFDLALRKSKVVLVQRAGSWSREDTEGPHRYEDF